MKIKTLLTVLTATCTFVACADHTPHQFNGVIVDATMNNVVVKSLTSDSTYDFSTENADKSAANGLLIGSPITIDYTGKLVDGVAATKIATDATYNRAVGEWTLPDPIDSTKVMGVEIDVQGAAQSINMATLAYKSWALTEKPDQILLKGQSLGNGQTIDFTDTCTLSTNAAGKLTLSTKGGGFVYIKNE